ncbi:MAG: hypothetical protein Q9191_001449 [Dirinaria sp. TL-2023a]
MPTMKEAHVHADTSVTIHSAPIPEISHPSQILIKVVVSGTNPKDWKLPAGLLKTIPTLPNSGDDIAGIVHAVGSAVHDFHVGDRVAALHELGTPGGSFAEYALAWDWTTFHLGDEVGFEAAAAVPMGALMAAIGLFGMLQITPGPWASVPADVERPLVIYGAAGTVGAYAVKLAKLVNVHPLICIAGQGAEFVGSLIRPEDGDVVVDYRNGDEQLVSSIRETLAGRNLEYAFDATSAHGSFVNLSKVLSPGGKLTLVLVDKRTEIPPHIQQSNTMAGSLWRDLSKDVDRDYTGFGKLAFERGKEFGLMFSRLIGRWLQEGVLQPHPFQVVEGGLEGLETALKRLREGKNSAMKYVVRIGDTPGLGNAV